MDKNLGTSEVFETVEAGVSSAYDPMLLQQNSLAWQVNGQIRGGKSSTRMGLKEKLLLPTGKVQGVSYFSIQHGMLVVSIAGRLYRVRVTSKDFSYEEISLGFINSPALPECWMEETSGYLIIQDGESNPVLYNGSTARRSDVTGLVSKELNGDNVYPEVPRGRMMAYINGRLWVVINDNELVAGDIKTSTDASELRFTENQYFIGGGAFYFKNKITAISGMPATGAAGYGALIVFGASSADSLRADITDRDLWQQMPGFIQPILLNSGCASHGSIAEVNQDIVWRDSDGSIRSIRSSVGSEATAGSTPVSEEISRIIDHESDKHLKDVSSIFFKNRYLSTASPFLNDLGGTNFRKLIALDFSPVSSMRAVGMPAYDGEWTGLYFQKLVRGKFDGRDRAFAISHDVDGNNRLWEILPEASKDQSFTYNGTEASYADSPIYKEIELPRRSWQNSSALKRLSRCDIFLSDIKEQAQLKVYWRKDNQVKWNLWDTVDVCARVKQSVTNVTPYIPQNLTTQGRPQIRTVTIPEVDLGDGTFAHVGFEFQIKVVLTGHAKIHRVVVWARTEDTQTFADRDETFDDCAEWDATGNNTNYLIPVDTPDVGSNQLIANINSINYMDVISEIVCSGDFFVSLGIFDVPGEPINVTSIAVTDGITSEFSIPVTVQDNSFEIGAFIRVSASGSMTITHTGTNSPMVFNIAVLVQ